ncbi:MAG: biotin transporter BioY [Cellulosilyticaceae bacterium]
MKAKALALCGLFAALTAIGAFIRIPLPPPMVPITLQFFFVVLAGILLGCKLGGISQLTYVLIGLSGVPVFTGGGGIGYVLRPTFGYIIGFVMASFVIGYMVQKCEKLSFWKLFGAAFTGLIVVYVIGVPYLYVINTFYIGNAIGLWTALWSGAIICLPGDLTVCGVTALVGMKVVPLLKRGKLGLS